MQRNETTGEEEGEEAPDGDREIEVLPVWADRRDEGCSVCTEACASGRAGRGHTDEAAAHPGQTGSWRPHARQAMTAGAAAVSQAADADTAAWPASGPHWLPPPREVSEDAANCSWHGWECVACGRHCRDLVARRRIQPGTELTIPFGTGGLRGWSGEAPEGLVTFDGGARTVRGWDVAAGAAVLWRSGPTGGREPAVTYTWLLPGGADSQEAEAWGARAALSLAAHELGADVAAPTVAGDNLAVVRYCAGNGRLLRPELHRLLDPGLNAAAAAGRAPGWLAVRRRHNQAADAASTAGCHAAAADATAGRGQPRLVVTRH